MALQQRKWLAALAAAAAIFGTIFMAYPAQARPATQTAPTATVLVDRLNVRSGPGTTYKVVGGADSGTQLTVVGQTGQCAWLKVAKGGKELGWVSGNKAYVKLSTSCTKIPAATAGAAPVAAPAGEGCATVINQLGFDVKIDVKRSDGWKDSFTVAKSAERQYCVAPGSYTATLSSSARPGAMSFPLTVQGGENYRIPLALPGQ
jgi:uncharacterized protein YgiM (DUF1202 family)